jgi:zinc protease
MLDEGAGDLDSQAFQKQLEDNSIELSFSAGRDGFFGSITTLRDTSKLAFDLGRLSLTRPRFDPDAVERMRNQILVQLKRDMANPGYVAQRTFTETVFPDHPYGKLSRGTPETVAAITRDDLAGFVKRRFARDTLKVGVSGDISARELGRVLDTLFGGLPAKAEPFEVPDVSPKGAGETIGVTRPVPQTIIIMGQEGLKRQDPDWYAGQVLNYVLGGGSFSSRLMDEVREKRGLTYGVSSSIQPFEHASLIMASGSTANAVAGQALDLMRQIWGEVGANGITEQELNDAKTYLTGSYPLSFTNNGAIAGLVLQVQRDRLGIDYLNKRNDLINAVTLDDVARVARRLLKPDALTTVVVGQPEGVKLTRTATGE